MSLTRILYLGTADIAVPTLAALHAAPDLTVCGVCTQPDRPSGRKRRLTPSPVNLQAQALGLPVITPEKVSTAIDTMADWTPDLLVVFAYGQYLPRRLCELPPLGAINLHPSLLPRYRGASPIQSALLQGDTRSGLSIIRVAEKMDSGDLLCQTPLDIDPEDTAETLSHRFAQLAAQEILPAIRALRDGTAVWSPQDESAVVECRKFAKADGIADWQLPASELHNRVRAFQPWPGMTFSCGGQPVKLLRTRVEPASGIPGTLLECGKQGLLIACGEQALRLLEVQPSGKNPMPCCDFLNGRTLTPGALLQ